jgi:hypothetical protein
VLVTVAVSSWTSPEPKQVGVIYTPRSSTTVAPYFCILQCLYDLEITRKRGTIGKLLRVKILWTNSLARPQW